jgi:biopolymer transport protein ExbD
MDFLKQLYDKIPAPLRNKYVLVLLSMFLWMAFFDSHNWIKQWRLKSEINALEEQKNFYEVAIQKDSIALHELTTNPETQEKFAREKYFMKKANEDVIVIIKDDE